MYNAQRNEDERKPFLCKQQPMLRRVRTAPVHAAFAFLDLRNGDV
jgi:hypothetical protein